MGDDHISKTAWKCFTWAKLKANTMNIKVSISISLITNKNADSNRQQYYCCMLLSTFGSWQSIPVGLIVVFFVFSKLELKMMLYCTSCKNEARRCWPEFCCVVKQFTWHVEMFDEKLYPACWACSCMNICGAFVSTLSHSCAMPSQRLPFNRERTKHSRNRTVWQSTGLSSVWELKYSMILSIWEC